MVLIKNYGKKIGTVQKCEIQVGMALRSVARGCRLLFRSGGTHRSTAPTAHRARYLSQEEGQEQAKREESLPGVNQVAEK